MGSLVRYFCQDSICIRAAVSFMSPHTCPSTAVPSSPSLPGDGPTLWGKTNRPSFPLMWSHTRGLPVTTRHLPGGLLLARVRQAEALTPGSPAPACPPFKPPQCPVPSSPGCPCLRTSAFGCPPKPSRLRESPPRGPRPRTPPPAAAALEPGGPGRAV